MKDERKACITDAQLALTHAATGILDAVKQLHYGSPVAARSILDKKAKWNLDEALGYLEREAELRNARKA